MDGSLRRYKSHTERKPVHVSDILILWVLVVMHISDVHMYMHIIVLGEVIFKYHSKTLEK